MMRVSKNHLYSCVFTTAIFSFLLNISVKAHTDSSLAASCDKNQLPYKCSDGAEHTISEKVYKLTKSSKEEKGRDNFLTSSAVVVAQEPSTIIQANHLQISAVDGAENTYGVVASQGGKVVLSDSTLKDVTTGLKADKGTIEVNRGTVEATEIAVHAEKQGASVFLTNAKIKVKGQNFIQGIALFSGSDAVIKMTGGSIDVENAAALYVGVRGRATLEGVSISSKDQQIDIDEDDEIGFSVFNVNQHGSISLKNSNVIATNIHGLWVGLDANTKSSGNGEEDILISRVNIESSKITVKGNKYGMYFDMDKGENEYQQGIVFLKNTTFDVPNGTAIHSHKSSGYIGLTEGTEISGDLLLTAEEGSSVTILADSSSLIGSSHVKDNSVAELYLTGGSKWVLTKRKEANSQDLSRVNSSISFVKLSDSSLIFEDSTLQEYQTLYVGKGGGEVYHAQDNARIYLNTHLGADGSLNNQKTDRLLIHGDVSGKTTVHVQFITASQGEAAGDENSKTISLIQVSGKAAEDSFQLNSSYIALEGLPYQYYLRAYGPNSSLGRAEASQRLVKGDGDFWDFRLESKYIQPIQNTSKLSHSERRVRDVVPQIPTYLLLPNALFHAGLIDINNQNEQLKTIRFVSATQIERTPTLFVHGYGGKYRYVPDLSALEYGYEGDLDYNAIEAGVLLNTIEGASNTTSFGIIGTYGKLSLQPQNVEQSQKSIFYKQSVTAYGNVEHKAGFYIGGLLSYGLLQGDVLTSVRGKTATLKGNPLNVSLSAGKAFITGYEGFIFDPQIQFTYQHLQFHKARDIDGFDIDMGNLDQWMMRIGGRLTKTFAEFEKDRAISLYGKIHFANRFGGKQFVHFKEAFQLGSFGSSLEAGLGINSQLSPKVALYGDLNYQYKLTKAGFTGIHFSGGLRYRF
ncbi:autotransporter outer membrane beta-barrel domain-containing protein [Bartonella raoultii]|uniref:autotransporter outer membrane beta-barrel domain-containing protein n=1 Tax=Bartonella raoultii TaxID=1457020 RepID=UPI001ABA699C|nr:autotransporter outer membrane beta-barrel domain-containing protein [Bartonella raoultii]